MNTVERRERLIRILSLRGKTTVRELADALEVSERTVYRDVVALSMTKPISASPGKGGGVFLIGKCRPEVPVLPCRERALLERIIAEAERTSSCSLSPSDLQLLKDLVGLYADFDNGKGNET